MSTITQIDMQPFCNNDPDQSKRYILSTPWRAGGFIYATDARRIARIPDDGRELPEQEGRRPNTIGMFEKFTPGEFAPLPCVPECHCEIGSKVEGCKNCWGTGEVTCNLDHEHDCDDCNGKGKVTVVMECQCEDLFDGAKFRRLLIEPFRSIAGVEYSLAQEFGKPTMVLRAPGGFCGIVMGIEP